MKKEEFYKEAIPGVTGALEGVKVLETTHFLAGPTTGACLADQGAEVIKVEMPRVGDSVRYAYDPKVDLRNRLNRSDLPAMEAGMTFQAANRNKKGITLDLTRPEGPVIFKELVKHMDVVVQDFKPGTMDGWGLGYPDIAKLKPDIIYTSISGYGQYGPYSAKPGYDSVGQALSGLMSVTGFADGPPLKVGMPIVDIITGWQGAMGTMAALVARGKTGRGQHVDANILDASLYASYFYIMSAGTGYIPERAGNRYAFRTVGNLFACKDGEVLMLVILDSHWKKLCQLMGREDLLDDPRCVDGATRSANCDFVEGVVTDWVEDKTVAEVLTIMDEAQLVACPIYDYGQVIKDEHILHREMVTEVEHPLIGRLPLYGVAPKLSVTPGKVRFPAPLLGQHNEEVYGTYLGYDQKRLAELEKQGII